MDINSTKPLYQQVEAMIKQDIVTKKYMSGDKLPTESELCEIYGVSKITVRKALSNLVEKKWIIRIQGKGTFVSYENEKYTLKEARGFDKSLSENGHISEHKIISATYEKANKKIAEKLNVSLGALLTHVVRVILADGVPIGLDNTYISDELFPGIMSDLTAGKSLYTILADKYNEILDYSILEINGSVANRETADLLNCLMGDPMFYVEKIGYGVDEKVLHYSVTTIRCDKVTYVIRTGDTSQVTQENKK